MKIMFYATEEEALARVDRLRAVGIWPGVRRGCSCGRPRCKVRAHPKVFTLLYDPPVHIGHELSSTGYLKGGSLW